MSPTSAQTIASLLNSGATLSPSEREALATLLAFASGGHAQTPSIASLLLTQKEAAALLGIDRTTVWRLNSMGILRPIEISPGTFRYQRSAVEALAQHGYRHLLKSQNALAA